MSLPAEPGPPVGAPPGASETAHRAVRRLARPVEEFLATEAAAGGVLLVVAIIALAWANSPWQATYHAIWSTPLGVQLGERSLSFPLSVWINDVLMTLFFFVVGLEIRREIARGELSDLKRASLPLAAALGGMVVPALLYLTLNTGQETSVGWGVPMATDIAFAVGVLAVLGRRVPPALRILLLALAVIDDVGAIMVIGFFYSGPLELGGLGVAAAGIGAILLMQRFGVRSAWLYVVPGVVIWEGIHIAGVHPTLAGVIVGLMTPARAWFTREALVDVMSRVVERVTAAPAHAPPEVHALAAATREAVAPVDHLQHVLHRWVAFVIMPLFAFANAGVTLSASAFDAATVRVLGGITLGLVLGKPLGIVLGAFVATRLGVATLPRGVTWKGVAVVGFVAGIGFTMSLFVAELAFHGPLLGAAKLGIICASALAAVLGLGIGVMALPQRAQLEGEAATASEAESSTAS